MGEADFLRSCVGRGLPLKQQGHRFARYADDFDRSGQVPASGERVMGSLTRYLEHTLKLKINPAKSRVALMGECSFLDFTVKVKKIRWTEKSQANFKHRVKALTGRSWGVLTRAEVLGVLGKLEVSHKLFASILYDCGMRLMEGLRLR